MDKKNDAQKRKSEPYYICPRCSSRKVYVEDLDPTLDDGFPETFVCIDCRFRGNIFPIGPKKRESRATK